MQKVVENKVTSYPGGGAPTEQKILKYYQDGEDLTEFHNPSVVIRMNNSGMWGIGVNWEAVKCSVTTVEEADSLASAMMEFLARFTK